MSLDLYVDNPNNFPAPELEHFQTWVHHALSPEIFSASVALILVNAETIQALNSKYREKNKATNVLAFPNQAPDYLDPGFLGDIIFCVEVIELEAKAQKKLVHAHWAHLTVHAMLHLQGYDHENPKDASIMEAKEIYILKELGFDDPYNEVTHE